MNYLFKYVNLLFVKKSNLFTIVHIYYSKIQYYTLTLTLTIKLQRMTDK